MSHGLAPALQAAVYQRLAGGAAVDATRSAAGPQISARHPTRLTCLAEKEIAR